MTKSETLITLDAVEPIDVLREEYNNEIGSLRTLCHGIKQLCSMVKNTEVEFERAGGDKVKVFIWGASSDAERHKLDTIACFFHWFGMSVCNYSRLVGFIRGLARGEFTRTDLKDPGKFSLIKGSIKG